jgi:hypothetical protein
MDARRDVIGSSQGTVSSLFCGHRALRDAREPDPRQALWTVADFSVMNVIAPAGLGTLFVSANTVS